MDNPVEVSVSSVVKSGPTHVVKGTMSVCIGEGDHRRQLHHPQNTTSPFKVNPLRLDTSGGPLVSRLLDTSGPLFFIYVGLPTNTYFDHRMHKWSPHVDYC